MKDYLDLVAKQGNLGVVNRYIGKRIAEKYNLLNKDLKGIPISNLIQTYSELEQWISFQPYSPHVVLRLFGKPMCNIFPRAAGTQS